MKCYQCETQITPGIDLYTWGTSRCGMPVPFHTGQRWHADNCFSAYQKQIKKEEAEAKLRALD